MTWPLQYRIDRIPPASSSAISLLLTNSVFPNSASSGSTLRVDSKRQRTSRSGSVVVSRSRAAFCANRASRASRRSRAASTSCVSASSSGSIFTGTRRGRTSSPIFTNTRCELSVTARAPVATSSAQTRTPTSSEDVPPYSTCALRIAIWPTPTGWRKSISSIAPRTTWPRATRTAASVPAWVIHSIIRPPWIWPGAPACSGKTHWTISTTVSAIDGIRALYHPPLSVYLGGIRGLPIEVAVVHLIARSAPEPMLSAKESALWEETSAHEKAVASDGDGGGGWAHRAPRGSRARWAPGYCAHPAQLAGRDRPDAPAAIQYRCAGNRGCGDVRLASDHHRR